ncbi:MAG: hypothetical protein SVS85_01950 [Candidatus Nanohaloarchaea archaeon]|nr:hypothetical protein [Candidatus Nanohaloarchaea archaeon]
MADRSHIQTGVDRLLEYVQENGEVELKEASEALGAERETAMSWASALEDSGLIEIHYSARRGRVLVPVEGGVSEDKVEEAREGTAEELEESEILEQEQTEIEQYKEVLDRIRESLEEDEKKGRNLEDELSGENLQKLRNYLEELGETEEEVDHLEEELDDIVSGLKVLEEMEKESGRNAESKEGRLGGLKYLLPWKSRTFKCEECGREFDTERGLETHRGMIHD